MVVDTRDFSTLSFSGFGLGLLPDLHGIVREFAIISSVNQIHLLQDLNYIYTAYVEKFGFKQLL